MSLAEKTDPLISPAQLIRWQRVAPFWMSLGLLPLAWISAVHGGWTVLLLPVVTWYLFAVADGVLGLDTDNADLSATEDDLYWYRAITLIWAPL